MTERKAYKCTYDGQTCYTSATTENEARSNVARSIKDAYGAYTWVQIKAVRAPQFDEWAKTEARTGAMSPEYMPGIALEDKFVNMREDELRERLIDAENELMDMREKYDALKAQLAAMTGPQETRGLRYPVSQAQPTQAFENLRSEFGEHFDAIEDPEAWVKAQRRGEG